MMESKQRTSADVDTADDTDLRGAAILVLMDRGHLGERAAAAVLTDMAHEAGVDQVDLAQLIVRSGAARAAR